MSNELQTIQLSDQALGAIMIALQNSLLHQTDIVPILKELKLTVHETEGLIVINPPILRTQPQESSMGTNIETSVQ